MGDRTAPDLDFKQAVHFSLYWAQDLRQGPICQTSPTPRALFKRARSGLPLTPEEILVLGEGQWPPPAELLDINGLPNEVVEDATKNGRVSWKLNESRLVLRKLTPRPGCTFVTDLEIVRGHLGPSIRVMLGHIGGYAPVPGTPVVMKVLSSVCGLYDGGVRLLPCARLVDTPEDAEEFVRDLEDMERQRPIVTVVAPRDHDDYPAWRVQVDACAKEAFALQHVVCVTRDGLQQLQELLGPHAPKEGSVKTYHSGFSHFDLKQAHPVMGNRTIESHETGLEGVLRELTTRMAAKDARVQRDEEPIIWSAPKGSRLS